MNFQKLLLVQVLAAAGFSGMAAEKTFELGQAPELQLKYRGQVLLSNENINWKNALAVDGNKYESKNGVINTWNTAPEFSWRREASTRENGSEVEITFQGRVPSYEVPVGAAGETLSYSFAADAALFDGMKFKAQSGRTGSPKLEEGVFRASQKDGNLFSGAVRFLSFEGKNTSLVFDFNPEGVNSYGDYGPGSLQGLWNVSKKGDKLVFSIGGRISFSGGTVTAKAVIFEGKFSDFLNRHVEERYSYANEMNLEHAYVFGAQKFGTFYSDAGTKDYDEKQKFGWLDASKLAVTRFAPSGAIYSSVGSEQEGRFKVSGVRPGVYMVTVRSAAYETPTGLFAIACNGVEAVRDLSLDKQQVASITFPAWIEDGSAEFVFKGSWRVSAILMQFLMHSKEDYKFRRGVWLSDGFEPGMLFRNADYAKPPRFQTVVEKTALAPHDFKAPENYRFELKRDNAPVSVNTDATAWCYSGVLGSLGPGNVAGDFNNFATAAEKERRIEELKQDRINAVIVNGMLSRHTYPSHLDRVTGFLRDFTAVAHRNNIRIIDHQDLTLLWNVDSGFRVMTERTDSLERMVDSDGVVRGLCPVNPHTRREYFDRTLKLIRDTDIDGLMVDEVYFLTPKLCGCRYCREKFTADTGLILPMDETSPVLFDNQNLIWKAWLSWRMSAIADWWREFRREVNQVKPDLAFLLYTTHYGWGSTFGSLNKASDLITCAGAIDFLGTEIMSRNVMASRRPVMAYRKMKNSIKIQYGKPIFGLVYPQEDWSIGYFGWALNNMNCQSSWFTKPPPAAVGMPDYFSFAENYPLRYARPAGRTAILFSAASRDWGRFLPHTSEVLGTSEAMTDIHMPHEFILGETLVMPEKMRNFRNLFIMGAMCMSDAEIAAVRSFAEQGGTVFLGQHSGLGDSLGMLRAKWPFADILGFSPRTNSKLRQATLLKSPWGDFEFDKTFVAALLQGKPKAAVKPLAFFGDKPMVFEVPFGRGRIVYSALPLGNATSEKEQTAGKPYQPGNYPELLKIYQNMLKELFAAGDDFVPVAIPAKVMVSTVEVAEPGKSPEFVVNLLNATGVEVAEGTVIPAKMPTDWGKITSPLVFQVKLQGMKEAFAVSPDFAGRKVVEVREIKPGLMEFTLPPELLKYYTQVRIIL